MDFSGARVYFDGVQQSTVSSNFSQLVFFAPPNSDPLRNAHNITVAALVFNQTITTSALSWTYSAPVLTSLSAQSTSTAGGYNLTLVGYNFYPLSAGASFDPLCVTFDNFATCATPWRTRRNDTYLEVAMPAGVGTVNVGVGITNYGTAGRVRACVRACACIALQRRASGKSGDLGAIGRLRRARCSCRSRSARPTSRSCKAARP